MPFYCLLSSNIKLKQFAKLLIAVWLNSTSVSLVAMSRREERKKENLKAHFCTLRVASVEQLYSREYLRYHNNITVLSLNGLLLKSLPDYIFSEVPNLSWLDVRFNKLISIPLSIRWSKRFNLALTKV